MSIITEEYLDSTIQQLKEVLRSEIPAFAELGHKFVNKEITSAEFKATSGGRGVYAQRSGSEFMIRLRAMGGILDYEKLNFLYDLANKYSLESIHLTTRQMVQLHHLKVDDMIRIMKDCIDHDMITRGSGGNFPRNATLSPLSGVEKGEAFDVTPYSILVNKYFLSQINTYRLPRKFKVAFSNHENDSAKASIADLGFLAVVKEGKEYFQVYLGGSMGPNGATSVPFDELIDPQDILYHVEAILSLFTEEGDYNNKAKARMRFIVQRMGREAFLECYKKHLAKIKQTKELRFVLNKEEKKLSIVQGEVITDAIPDAIKQKQSNFYSVDIHPQAGFLSTKALGDILQFIRDIKVVEVRLTMEGSMIIRNLTATQAKELLELTKEFRKTTRLGKSISCVGASICQIGIQTSQTLLANILDYFEDKGFQDDILPSLAISGCTNSCSRHQVGEIGFQGKMKRVNDVLTDAYALQVGGSVSYSDIHLAREYGDLAAAMIPEFLYELALVLKERKLEFRDYIAEQEEEFKSLVAQYSLQ
jgi:ferredoxin-nitrite reductase